MIKATKQEKKSKKSKVITNTETKEIVEPDSTQIKTLVDARSKAVEDYISGWSNVKNRVTVKTDYTSGDVLKDGAKASDNPDFVVEVAEIVNLLK